MSRLPHKEGALAGALVVLGAGTFVLDVLTPLSFAVHVLYAAVVLLATASRLSWMPLVTAGAGAGLTVIAWFFCPPIPGMPEWIPIGNRVLTIIMLFVLSWFSLKRRQAEAALQAANEGLEAKVQERTQELAGVNQALVSEVTERMQAEHAFRLSEGRLAGILDLAEDAIIVIDQDRAITLFNQGAVKLFGYEPHEILSAPIDRLLTEPLHVDPPPSMEAVALTAEPARRLAHPREVQAVRSDGTAFPAEASVSKLTVAHKTTWTIILRDMTDRLRAEQQLHSLTAQLITVQEEERRRISRELHDDINQRLALVAIEMGSLEAHPPASVEGVRSAFQSLTQRLASISDDVRRMAYQFHPSVLDDLGLFAALQSLTDEFSEKTGIKIVLVQEEFAEPLPKEIASCLYRITQESLANVTKHAQTSRVELELTCDGQEITLSIRDGGVGFDLERVRAHHGGLGLVNMRERVRSIHGRLEIQSQPGEGTHIIVNIPFPGAPHEHPTSTLSR
jgi:PAS domain S-box-containing protein